MVLVEVSGGGICRNRGDDDDAGARDGTGAAAGGEPDGGNRLAAEAARRLRVAGVVELRLPAVAVAEQRRPEPGWLRAEPDRRYRLPIRGHRYDGAGDAARRRSRSRRRGRRRSTGLYIFYSFSLPPLG